MHRGIPTRLNSRDTRTVVCSNVSNWHQKHCGVGRQNIQFHSGHQHVAIQQGAITCKFPTRHDVLTYYPRHSCCLACHPSETNLDTSGHEQRQHTLQNTDSLESTKKQILLQHHVLDSVLENRAHTSASILSEAELFAFRTQCKHSH